jgi:hypothetical protein
MSIITNQNTNRSKYARRYNPRHPLAQQAVSQIDKLELRPQDIVKVMGYPIKHTIPACDRLRYVLSSDKLGLDGSYIDACFTASEFLKALLVTLEMQYEPFHDDITQIEYDLAHYPNPLPKYTLRADVDFEFTAGANWMSRGVAASKANAYLPEDIAKMNESKRESIVQKCIDEHYKRYNGQLPYNGVITGYRLITKQHNEIIDRVKYELPKCE